MRKRWVAVFLAGALAVSNLTIAGAENRKDTASVQAQEEDPADTAAGSASDVGSAGTAAAPGTDGVDAGEILDTSDMAGVDTPDTADGDGAAADAQEDRVYIADEVLREALAEGYSGVEIDEDGCASRADMEEIQNLDLRGVEGIADLTGLEAAVNLNWLTMSECGITSDMLEENGDVLAALPKLETIYLDYNEITDLGFLSSIPQAGYIVLSNNQITDFTPAFEFCGEHPDAEISYSGNPAEGLEQIFEKCYLSVSALMVGQEAHLELRENVLSGQSSYGFADGENLGFAADDPEILEISQDSYTPSVRAAAPGTANITVTYNGKERTFPVTVSAAEAAVEETERLDPDELAQGMSARSILTNGQIWNWDSADTPQKVSDGKKVKSYVAYWVYRPDDPEKTGRTFTEEYFGLDENGTLWNWKKLYSSDPEYMETEIDQNVRTVVHYEGRAALYITDSDECFMSYIDGTEKITQKVCDSAESVNENGYVGLKDGSGLILSLDDDNKVLTEAVEFQPVDVGYYSEYDPEAGMSRGYEFMLDSNGTIWSRPDGSDAAWEKTQEGVSTLAGGGYIKDNTYYPFDETSGIIEDVEEIFAGTAHSKTVYLKTDDTLCAMDGTEILRDIVDVDTSYALDVNGDLYYFNRENETAVAMHSVTGLARDSYHEIVVQREDGSIWRCAADNSSLPERLASHDDFIEYVSCTDEETGIKVDGVEYGLTLNVDPVTDEAALSELSEKAEELAGADKTVNALTVYDITLTKNGKEVDPEIPVTVTIPVPDGYDTANLAVYHQKDDGSLETISCTVSGDGASVSFLAEEFSPYLLASLAAAEPEDPDEPTADPEDPDQPADPDEPAADPEDPDQPADPDEPAADPEEPNQPADPDQGGTDNGSAQDAGAAGAQAVKTGDSTPVTECVMMLLAAAGVILVVIAAKKKSAI